MKRAYFLQQIDSNFRVHHICALLGPRQVGKTTLARMYVEQHSVQTRFFDLENSIDLAQLENPMLALSSGTYQLIVIDEIQRKPELFPILRVIVDAPENKKRFLILGNLQEI